MGSLCHPSVIYNCEEFCGPSWLDCHLDPIAEVFRRYQTRLDIPLRKPLNQSEVETQLLFTLQCRVPQMTDKCHWSISFWGWCCHGYYPSCIACYPCYFVVVVMQDCVRQALSFHCARSSSIRHISHTSTSSFAVEWYFHTILSCVPAWPLQSMAMWCILEI